MASYNKLIAIGYLGRDPESRTTQNGTDVCDFSLATTERQKDKHGEYKDVTTWFRVTVWGKMAETAAKYLSKGSHVYVEGRLTLREWQDRDGNNRSSLEVTCTELRFLDSKDKDSRDEPRRERKEEKKSSKSSKEDDDFDEELGF